MKINCKLRIVTHVCRSSALFAQGSSSSFFFLLLLQTNGGPSLRSIQEAAESDGLAAAIDIRATLSLPALIRVW